MQCTEMDVNKGYQLIHEFYIPGFFHKKQSIEEKNIVLN